MLGLTGEMEAVGVTEKGVDHVLGTQVHISCFTAGEEFTALSSDFLPVQKN